MDMNKMKAIWSFLDDMLEQDADKYKAFIEEQLAEAKKYESNKTANPENASKINAGFDGDFLSSLNSFANLDINKGASGIKPKLESSASNQKADKKDMMNGDTEKKTGVQHENDDEILDIVIPVSGAPTRPKIGKNVGPLIQVVGDTDENGEAKD